MRSFVITLGVAAVVVALSSRLGAGATDARAITYISAAAVDAAFAKGVPMLETPAYKIHASRREGPGMAEIHTRDTDILYVRQGTATIVTGGEAIDAQRTAPDEWRGTAIRNGDARQLVEGDVLVVPAGVPHQFTHTSAPFLYYVVKTTAPMAGGTQ